MRHVTVSEGCLPSPAELSIARNPSILPPSVRQCSVAIGGDEETFGEIVVPASLAAAAAVRRLHYRAGRFCAARALSMLLGGAPPDGIGRDASGIPAWPAGVVGSITHTAGFASAAVALASEVLGVGIDTEAIIPRDRAKSVSATIAWPAELAPARAAGCSPEQALTLAFTVKEAIFKCLFPLVGRRFGFHDVRLVAVDGASRTFRARIVMTLGHGFEAGTTLEGRFELADPFVHAGMAMPARA